MSKETVVVENAKSIAQKPLPSVPGTLVKDHGSILLFYQYKEPVWSKSEHKKALRQILNIGKEHKITGRGRVAPEGVNCTLSSATPQAIRQFCQALRDWEPSLFEQTDFKITDNVPPAQLFKSLSIRKTDELVAYGLAGDDKAPSLEKFAGQHLTADDYHQAMQDRDTVIIDVRNAYETAIGRLQPPTHGATLLDPKMRNSIEWSQWLADKKTQKQLDGKKVLMYCTGGIRCERATALLNEMSAVNQVETKGVYELQGGIERYIKTFPDGGYWKGKNYLFDRRMEQVPANKPLEQIEAETDSVCCRCRTKWTIYRGKFKCREVQCGVPVIVCDTCKLKATADPDSVMCELCREGYKAPSKRPDLVKLKRQAESLSTTTTTIGDDPTEQDNARSKKKAKTTDSFANERTVSPNQLFISRLPLTVTKTKLAEWLNTKIERLHWYADKDNGAFYGSCMVQLSNVDRIMEGKLGKLDKKRPKVARAMIALGETWPSDCADGEFPPLGR